MNKAQHRRLFSLLAQPTAPFREQHVIREVERQLLRTSIPYFFDPHGNIVLGVSSAAAYKAMLKKKTDEPVRVFIAHMDHPGFHGQRWLGDKRSQIVYDLDEVTDESVINDLIESGQYLVFGPDSLAEARNRGYRHRAV